MGYIKHNSTIVVSWKEEDVVAAHEMAKEIFSDKLRGGDQLISPILNSVVNDDYSFFIAPDGSKEGWSDSKMGDLARIEFLDWLHNADNYCDYIDVRFGGDDEHENIVRSKDTDLASETIS